QCRIAYLKGVCGEVGAVREKLFRRRRALGPKTADAQKDALRRLQADSARDGNSVEFALEPCLLHLMGGVLIARADLESPRSGLRLLKTEEAVLQAVRRRRERLFADC